MGLKAGLLEVFVGRERLTYTVLLHDRKARTVGQAPAFIPSLAVDIKCRRKTDACLRFDQQVRSCPQGFDQFRGSVAEIFPAPGKFIEELGKNPFAGDNPVIREPAGCIFGLAMQLIAWGDKRNPKRGVSEYGFIPNLLARRRDNDRDSLRDRSERHPTLLLGQIG